MNTKLDRNINLDLIRVLSMLFVIAIHTNSKYAFIGNKVVTVIIMNILFFCNCGFYMLSGELNLQNKLEYEGSSHYKNFYLRKLISILFPYILVTCLLSLGKLIKNRESFTFFFYIKHTYSLLMSGNASIHLWYMYPLMGMLLSAPFLAKLLSNMTDWEVKLLFAIGVIWNIVSIFLTRDIGVGFSYSGWLFSEWPLYFYAGYFCNRIINEKNKKTLYVFGVFCFLINISGIILIPEHFFNAYDLAPTMLIFSMAFYVFLKTEVTIHWKWMKQIIGFLAKHSFMIYMLHWHMLFSIVSKIIIVLESRISIGFCGAMAATVLGSMIVAIPMNTCIIFPIQKFMKRKFLLPLTMSEK